MTSAMGRTEPLAGPSRGDDEHPRPRKQDSSLRDVETSGQDLLGRLRQVL